MINKEVLREIAKKRIDKVITKKNLIEQKDRIDMKLSLIKESDKIENELYELMGGSLEESGSGYEVHFSDGVSQMKKFKDLPKAEEFAKKLIDTNKTLKFVDVYQDKPGFHSTADADYLIKWWGDGHYWDNMSKIDDSLLSKKLEYNPEIKEDDLTGDDEQDAAIDSYLDEVMAGDVSDLETGQREPVFAIKGSSLTEDGDENDDQDDDMEECWAEFANSEKNGPPEEDGLDDMDDFQVDTSDDELDKQTNWYDKANDDLSEMMDKDEASKIVDDTKKIDEINKNLSESFNRMKVLAKI